MTFQRTLALQPPLSQAHKYVRLLLIDRQRFVQVLVFSVFHVIRSDGGRDEQLLFVCLLTDISNDMDNTSEWP